MAADPAQAQAQAPQSTLGSAASAVASAVSNTVNPILPAAVTGALSSNASPNNQISPPQAALEGVGEGPQIKSTSEYIETLCGPLLNYRRMGTDSASGALTWYGSVLIVTTPGQQPPELKLRCLGPLRAEANNNKHSGSDQTKTFVSSKLYEDPRKGFWKFDISLPFQDFEARWEYHVPRLQPAKATPSAGNHATQSFVVPAISQSMRIMFHSCNGFSVGTDIDAWCGPVLWNDVLRMHTQQPFHVMIGGGDQIYNDSVRVDGPLRAWTDISNPRKRREFPFDENMRAQCDDYYFDNYVRWYGQEPFATANGQIPQINIWDDHDIIDGFGSYTDRFMRCHVFRGIGGVAHKYYMLFQHHLPPPKSTFTTAVHSETYADGEGTAAPDPVQLQDTYVSTEPTDEQAYILGTKPGPYIEERSRSLYCQLGARIAFLGIDARSERTRHQINYPETYDLLFKRMNTELTANPEIKHLILLLGVPIAYPRLQWLENIISSPIIGPIRFLNKRFGLGGSLFNKFDGQVDLLDDLDDHYTARQHKHERADLVQRLQAIARQHSVRVTILGGDVHLGAIGRFYSKPAQGIPAERDWRYMVNVVSSAITNKPPPQAVANLLASRNKIHHLDHDTDETLLECFDHDPGFTPNSTTTQNGDSTDGLSKKTSASNHCTMPSRNYAIIWESHEHPEHAQEEANGTNGHLHPNAAANGSAVDGITAADPALPATPAAGSTAAASTAATSTAPNGAPLLNGDKKLNPRHPLHSGEVSAGSTHPASGGLTRSGLGGRYGLDITLRVEISNKDREGKTDGYGLTVPGLDASAYSGKGDKW